MSEEREKVLTNLARVLPRDAFQKIHVKEMGRYMDEIADGAGEEIIARENADHVHCVSRHPNCASCLRWECEKSDQ